MIFDRAYQTGGVSYLFSRISAEERGEGQERITKAKGDEDRNSLHTIDGSGRTVERLFPICRIFNRLFAYVILIKTCNKEERRKERISKTRKGSIEKVRKIWRFLDETYIFNICIKITPMKLI